MTILKILILMFSIGLYKKHFLIKLDLTYMEINRLHLILPNL